MSRNKLSKYIPRLMALLLSLVLILSCVPAVQAAESGTCGDNLTWTLSDGILTISGSGKMEDVSDGDRAPWYPYRGQIFRVELPDGLTTIGESAFYECSNLSAVSIPDSVTSIRSYAFLGCDNLSLLNLGAGMTYIGDYAFYKCTNLPTVSFSASLRSIGEKAFYGCQSITSVKIPSSVIRLGAAAFSYCTSLVSADIQARIDVIPEFLFYGCERLTSVSLPSTTTSIPELTFDGCDQLKTVYYNGTDQSLTEIQNSIGNSVPDFSASGSVKDEPPSEKVTVTTSQNNSDGTTTNEKVTVVQRENSSISSKVETTKQQDGTTQEENTDITVTIGNKDGWEEAKETVESLVGQSPSDHVDVDVYLQGTDEVDPDFVEHFAGQNVTVNVTTQNGQNWKIDCSLLDEKNLSGKYDLSYTLSAGTDEQCAELGTNSCFILRFHQSAKVGAEVLVRVGASWAGHDATLYERAGEEMTKIQTTVVDRNGNAHFYLASVSQDTEYCIAVDVVLQDASPIIPQELFAEYGNIQQQDPIRYEITGRTSSWGMNLGQVMGILAAVMVSVIVIVGVTMYILNKRRLKNGYVPQWDDEDDD